jgi:hypothetical protein
MWSTVQKLHRTTGGKKPRRAAGPRALAPKAKVKKMRRVK